MQPKRFEYRASLARDGSMLAEGGSALKPDDAWLPEHLVLVAIAQCTLASLRFYAKGADVSGSAEATGVVSRRDDGRYGFVEIEVLLDVSIDPAPSPDELPSLLARAERGCFVGNSLTPHPRTVWRVDGATVEPG